MNDGAAIDRKECGALLQEREANMAQTPLICRHLADLASEIANRPLPQRIESEARLCLLDFLASVLAAPLDGFADEAAAMFGTGAARLLHDGRPISATGAAYLHGFYATLEDIDDAHALASGMHVSATVLPATLALAQCKPPTQACFLRAIVAGYEVAGRLARSMDGGMRAKGFHSTGVIGPFAACVASGLLLGLDRDQLANALGIAASAAGGLFAFLPTGAGVRHTHAANAGVTGLLAAVAAGKGVTGPATAFEGPDGLVEPYAGRIDLGFVHAAAPWESGSYEILNVYHKRFNACGHAIPTITLILEMRDQILPVLDRIVSVEISGYRASAALTNFPAHSVGKAKFSLPTIFALAVLYGDVSGEEMSETVLARPEVTALAAKVSVREDKSFSEAFPGVRSGALAITLTDGRELKGATTNPIGMPANPLAYQAIARKFAAVARARLKTSRADGILRTLETLGDTEAPFEI